MHFIKHTLLFMLILACNTVCIACPDVESYRWQSKMTIVALDHDEQEPNMDGIVEVSFKIDDSGKVEIIKMNSTSPLLAEYVIKKLSKIQLQQVDKQAGKIIRYRFVFKKQA